MTALGIMTFAATLLAVFFFVKWQQAERREKQAQAAAAAHNEQRLLASSRQQDLEQVCAAIEGRFAVLAQQALKTQGEQQAQLASTTIGGVLGKLEKDIAIFREQVAGLLHNHRTSQAVFEEKFRSLEQNVGSIGKDADNLARALRGSSKVRGDWGEVALVRALEAAGLREGEAYLLQPTYNFDGKTVRPDVVLQLPGDRQVVIDAKVSLDAYLDYCEADGDEAGRDALKRLHAAMTRQIGEVRDKYLQIKELNSLGFAIMYTPLEPAWQLMMAEYKDMFAKARALNVIVLGPTNLLATLRIVENIWQAERSSRNVQKIVERASKMHGAAARLMEDIDRALKQHETLGNTLQQLQTTAAGRRGLLGEAKRLEELGAGSSKQLPQAPAPPLHGAKEEAG